MKIKFINMRYSSEREQITIHLLPTIKLILNEYGDKWCPNWELRIGIIWFWICFVSTKCGKAHSC